MGNSGDGSNILDKRFREVGTGTATGNYKGIKGYTIYTTRSISGRSAAGAGARCSRFVVRR
jgi:hypothetical protein